MNILVCGFMGAGKSTFVERFRFNDLGYEVLDLDIEIAKELGISPVELASWINKNGLSTFRQIESETLKKRLSTPTPKLISLGGGSVEAPDFLSTARGSKLVFIDCPFDICYSRIKTDKSRPLVALGEEKLRALYNQRLPLYQKADLVLSIEEIKEIEGLQSLVHNLTGE